MTHNKPFEGSLPDQSPSQDPDQDSAITIHNNETEQTFLAETDLAKRWCISTRKLQSDRMRGDSVHYAKLGRTVRYRLEDVIAWERKNTRQSTSET